MCIVLHAYHSFCKSKAESFRADHDKLKQDLATATEAMQADLLEAELTACRSTIREALECHHHLKIAGRRVRSRIRWRAHGDLVTKEFFAAVKERPQTTPLSALKQADGSRITEVPAMEAAITDFYSRLYAGLPSSEAHLAAEEAMLRHIPPRFLQNCSPDQVAAFGAVPTKEELGDAIQLMARDRSPGPDGVLVEFYS
ncbi:hypothetical protein KC19_VG213500 [Ceratodon purpureus]|uniref:Uncharacterized protein n=1 Tax=Ceratodon purpureus TaxID=3225 RepID=A0A8T0HSY1_CERPU|nr:hypothetical protein KC19_VG213500 [Ceratodon purpureus]